MAERVSPSTSDDMTLKPPAGHLPALDGLRGFAVAWVMFHHFVLEDGLEARAPLEKATQVLALMGWCGVDLFFVLSGFLITGILYDSRQRPNYYRTFYTRRVLRIFPLCYLFLAARFFVFPHLSASPIMGKVDLSEQVWLWSYLTNIKTAVGNSFDAVPLGLGHFWSLAIEEQFYMVWPFLVVGLSRRSLLSVCGMSVVVCCVVRLVHYQQGSWIAAYVSTPGRIDGLAIGAALALLLREPAHFALVRRAVYPLLAFATSGLVVIALFTRGFWRESVAVGTVGYTLVDLAFASILLISIDRRPSVFGTLAKTTPLRFLGKYSYAIYVFHLPVAIALAKHGVNAVTLTPHGSPAILGRCGFVALCTAATLALALLSWGLFEKHFIGLKDRMTWARHT